MRANELLRVTRLMRILCPGFAVVSLAMIYWTLITNNPTLMLINMAFFVILSGLTYVNWFVVRISGSTVRVTWLEGTDP